MADRVTTEKEDASPMPTDPQPTALFPFPLPNHPEYAIGLSQELRENAIKSLARRMQTLGAEVKAAGEQLDRLGDGTPEHIRREKRDRYLTALERLMDARDTLKKLLEVRHVE